MPLFSEYLSTHSNWMQKIPWDALKKIAAAVFFALVAWLIYSKAKELDWQKVYETFINTEPQKLLIGFMLGLCCYAVYASFDLLGRYLVKAEISKTRTFCITWIAYAFNLNFGALIGSVALRYRLYSRAGVKTATVAKIFSLSVLTNWLGYFVLAGLVMTFANFEPPDNWMIQAGGIKALGIGFLLTVCAYVGFCLYNKKDTVEIREHSIPVPTKGVLAWQFGVSMAHWLIMASIMYQFLGGEVSFQMIFLGVVISSIAGVLSHVPGGLGVIESVFLVVLAGKLPQHEILAGVFAYRCVYYLAPLILTLPFYLFIELFIHKHKG